MKIKISDLTEKIKFEYKIGIIYAIIGFLWIFFSDTIVNFLVTDRKLLVEISIFKGSFYVVITSLLLILMLKRHMKKLRESELLVRQRTDEIEAQNEEYKQLNEELHFAKEKAETSDNLKSAFLQNMSHEIRTPLNAIVGFSQFLVKPNLTSDKLDKYSKLILASSDKLVEIITDVIEISQIHAKMAKVKNSEFDIFDILDNIAFVYGKKSEEKKIDFKLSINIPLSKKRIISDQEKLIRIVTHLVDNAVKFTINGGVEILCESVNNHIQISVIDSGIGISPEMQNTVFEPFRQVETGICRDYGGNGLGLSIVKAYAELMNGTILLSSEPNIGTRVVVTIPMINSKNEIEESLLKEPIDSIYTILIAEDEYSNYLFLAEILEEFNLKILYAADGKQAVDYCFSNPEIGLVFMDIKMPVMDGITATKHIKELRPELPVIAQTAYALENEINLFKSIFDDYITKPIVEKELKHKLAKYLDLK